jgi:hypothetical protein
MPPDERADLSAGSSAADGDVTTTDFYVRVRLDVRREHRDWTAAEHAAWLDLYLASYEHRGRFESLDLIRAYLGPRAGALDALIARGELFEEDNEWRCRAYLQSYDDQRKPWRLSRDRRLQLIEEKVARGEPLSNADRAARYRAKRDFADVSQAENETQKETQTQGHVTSIGSRDSHAAPPPHPGTFTASSTTSPAAPVPRRTSFGLTTLSSRTATGRWFARPCSPTPLLETAAFLEG